MKVVIFSCSTGGGHNSCARYIEDEFRKNNIEADFVNYLKLNKKKLIRVYNNISTKYIFKKRSLKKEIKYIDKILKKN